MTENPKFCGECGSILPEGALFCGACGSPVAPSKDAVRESSEPRPSFNEPGAPPTPGSENRSQRSETPSAPVQADQKLDPGAAREEADKAVAAAPPDAPGTMSATDIMRSGLSWGIAWLAGWAPLGLFMGYFWEENRLRHAEFFDRYGYDPGWGYTLPGAAVGFGLGGLLGGFVAGVILCKAVPRVCTGIRTRAIIVTLLWLVGWAVAIGSPAMTFLSGYSVSDDTLLFLSFGAALVVSILAAQVALYARAGSPPDLRRLVVTLGWIGAAIMASFSTVGFIGL
ncbi:zinc ribbon domain-containing protein [Marimonas arenosa]|uniref:Zinc ribbon domain-containing protein n=1 Tax=Marimonas arenosa TaxID=1795305 RepID=A0AAE3WCG0_9RHOB|nr:zinc ribbon domain-containing protein [Marimonas arenosa]MDQ2090074.1 zinc ribbon domain-containing protein [Marimonas arenosa]